MKKRKRHQHRGQLCIVCVHLREGMEWFGVPTEHEFFDWLCKRCLEKYRRNANKLAELQVCCPDCIRQMQGWRSTLHFPVREGDGWHYEGPHDGQNRIRRT